MEPQYICGAFVCWSHSISVDELYLHEILVLDIVLMLYFPTIIEDVYNKVGLTKKHQKNISMDSTVPNKIHPNDMSGHNPAVQTFGVFQKYPSGVFNPAFTGMFILDYSSYNNLREYKICKFHCIKSGIILYDNEAFVMVGLHLFTLETNPTNRVKKFIRCRSDMEPCKLVSLIVSFMV